MSDRLGSETLGPIERARLLAALVETLLPGDDAWPNGATIGVQAVLATRLYELRGEDSLDKLVAVLRSKTAPAVEIQGHMDNIGEAGVASRQLLSEGRARTIAAWLTSHGVPAARVSAKGYGKTRPVADNDSDLGRALNRRIEVACLRR